MKQSKPIDVNRQSKLTPPTETITPEKSGVTIVYKITPKEYEIVPTDRNQFSKSDRFFMVASFVVFALFGLVFLSLVGVPK
jgi:hypothetical protein